MFDVLVQPKLQQPNPHFFSPAAFSSSPFLLTIACKRSPDLYQRRFETGIFEVIFLSSTEGSEVVREVQPSHLNPSNFLDVFLGAAMKMPKEKHRL